jgi:hypothetical protein
MVGAPVGFVVAVERRRGRDVWLHGCHRNRQVRRGELLCTAIHRSTDQFHHQPPELVDLLLQLPQNLIGLLCQALATFQRLAGGAEHRLGALHGGQRMRQACGRWCGRRGRHGQGQAAKRGSHALGRVDAHHDETSHGVR